jgi:cation-transporting ATPase F
MRKKSNGPILSRPLVIRMCLVAALMLVFAFGLFEWMKFRGSDTRAATTVAVNVGVQSLPARRR